ncbi:hypothetical protein [Filimonas lacunae]|nr:hypothetical protein [Filimonas lacunae]BAV08027.1 hypothetical protein FLA_4060 [Filimonas lacunae]
MKLLLLIPFTIVFSLFGNAQEPATSVRTTNSLKLVTRHSLNNADDSLPATEKEISFETALEKGTDILIENNGRTIELKTWDQPKVKIVTQISFKGNNTFTDEEWFEKLSISWKKFGGSFRLMTNSNNNSYGNGSYNWNYNGDKPARMVSTSKKKTITIFVPAQVKVEAESRSGGLSFSGKLESLKLITKNTAVELGDVNTLTLRSQNDNIAAGNIKDAFIEMNNGHFTAKNIANLDVDSRYSSVDAVNIDKAVIRSNNDEYEVETIGNVRGIKSYGTLRIATIKNTIELEGVNADIKIRNIAPSVEYIKLDNKYADLRLPAADLKNYTVSMEGSYNSVYASFEKIPIPSKDSSTASNTKTTHASAAPTAATAPKAPNNSITTNKVNGIKIENGQVIDINTDAIIAEAKQNAELDKAQAYSIRVGGKRLDKESNFTAKTGDGSGPKFVIKCTYCSIDFK